MASVAQQLVYVLPERISKGVVQFTRKKDAFYRYFETRDDMASSDGIGQNWVVKQPLTTGLAAAFVAGAEWEMEAGGISLEALAKLTGGTASQVGSTPNRTLTLSQDAGAQMPYLRIAGRAVSDTGDVICRLYRAKVEALEGTFRDGEFWVTYMKGVAVTNGSIAYEFVQQETAAAL